MTRKSDAANFAISIIGVCIFLTVANTVERLPGKVSAIVTAVLLVLRAVRYGLKMRRAHGTR